ncbi:uncharacterized protein LOC132165163 [Corylus avellana]|uniref:uncharacterized protein LOC132165163 n=1 Tax=Corylus avellana TaxID=13451 RepID=UPI001E21DBB3|nr:uncharacterized protein LOC132165163 [Corylus avellana]
MCIMKEPCALYRRRRPSGGSGRASEKVKLVCSFNGSFRPIPPSGELKYVGGEARIISVDRSIGLSKLRSKISDLFPATRPPSFSLKYQLSHRASEGYSTLLVSVASDDDVRCMIDEYDELELYGKHARLWLFVCAASDNVNAFVQMGGNLVVNCVENYPFCTKNSVACVKGVKYGDDSLRKFVLKQQFLAKQSACCVRLNRENIMPCDGNFHSYNDHPQRYSHGEGVWGGLYCGIRSHRVGENDARNQQIISYHALNYRNNPVEIGSHRTFRLGERVLVGKFCHGLRPNSNISKQGQCMRVCHPNSSKIPYQALHGNFYVPVNLQLQKEITISKTELGCNSELSDEEAGSNGADDLQGGVSTSVDFSLHNLSLSSSKEVGTPMLSSPATSNVADEKDHVNEKEIQQDPPSGLSIDDTIIGGIPINLAACYTHLSTRELQTIKNTDLEYIKEIGSGMYGTVYYGKWKGSDVAIKRIKPSCFTGDSLGEDRLVTDFWKEAHVLGELNHPNIVAFYGVVTDGPVTNLAAVTEYMVNGSLKQVLRTKDRTIDRRKRIIIAMDAAFGMEYLHGKNIVHFDLKSHNLLVNMRDPHRPVCKIGDLGLSKIKQKTLVSGGIRGTIPWMAPELLNSKDMVTEKVDVYSFGIVMWELLTGEEPYVNLRSKEIIAGIIKGNLRLEIPSWCDPTWRSLMERCWSSDPDSRPAFSEIAKELRTMSATLNIK